MVRKKDAAPSREQSDIFSTCQGLSAIKSHVILPRWDSTSTKLKMTKIEKSSDNPNAKSERKKDVSHTVKKSLRGHCVLVHWRSCNLL